MITVVLFEPKIPPNTGSTGRLCGATNTRLHIVGKLGFELSDKTLKRAGLDYWEHINWNYFPDTDEYMKNLIKNNHHFHLLTTKASTSYTKRKFQNDDYLIFGSETKGIKDSILQANWEKTCTIPMVNSNIRSLNLATSVGIVLYEALRQNGL